MDADTDSFDLDLNVVWELLFPTQSSGGSTLDSPHDAMLQDLPSPLRTSGPHSISPIHLWNPNRHGTLRPYQTP
jgi:hypothetical protein